MHNATGIATFSANQRPNTPYIRLWIDITFWGPENSYRCIPGVDMCMHKKLTLPVTHELLKVELSYFTCAFLVTRPFHGYKILDLGTLTLKFDPLLKNFNLGNSFLTRKGRAFIFHSHVHSLGQDFVAVPHIFCTNNLLLDRSNAKKKHIIRLILFYLKASKMEFSYFLHMV